MAFPFAACFLMGPLKDVKASFSQISAGAYLKPKSSAEVEGICQGCGATAQMHEVAQPLGCGGVTGLPQEILVLWSSGDDPHIGCLLEVVLEHSFCFHCPLLPQAENLSLLLPGLSRDLGCRKVQLSVFKVWTASAHVYKAWSGETVLWRCPPPFSPQQLSWLWLTNIGI